MLSVALPLLAAAWTPCYTPAASLRTARSALSPSMQAPEGSMGPARAWLNERNDRAWSNLENEGLVVPRRGAETSFARGLDMAKSYGDRQGVAGQSRRTPAAAGPGRSWPPAEQGQRGNFPVREQRFSPQSEPPVREQRFTPENAEAAQLAERGVQRGYLHKLGKNVTKWKRRFFVLQPTTMLYYYLSAGDTEPAGVVNMDLFTEVLAVEPVGVSPGGQGAAAENGRAKPKKCIVGADGDV